MKAIRYVIILLLMSESILGLSCSNHHNQSYLNISSVYPKLSGLRDPSTLAIADNSQIDPSRPIVVCFFCGCNNCHQTAKDIAKLSRYQKQNNLYAIFSIGPADAQQFIAETHFPGKGLLDTDEKSWQAYGVNLCPRVFILKNGRLLYTNKESLSPLNASDLSVVVKYLNREHV